MYGARKRAASSSDECRPSKIGATDPFRFETMLIKNTYIYIYVYMHSIYAYI